MVNRPDLLSIYAKMQVCDCADLERYGLAELKPTISCRIYWYIMKSLTWKGMCMPYSVNGSLQFLEGLLLKAESLYSEVA